MTRFENSREVEITREIKTIPNTKDKISVHHTTKFNWNFAIRIDLVEFIIKKDYRYFMHAFFEKYYIWFSRISIFIVYFWFGSLKLIGYSPAHELVASLLDKTFPFMSIDVFILILGYFEVFIGILWLIPKVEKIVLSLTVVHIVTTFGPLVFLPAIAWENFLVPTLVGQYILKNFLILSLGIVIYLKHAN